MPYVECSRCGLTAFTAAYWVNTEWCARCGAELPRPRRHPTSTGRSELERAVRERLYPRGAIERVDRNRP